ncbi:MAG: hypothetical protein K2J46_09845 [Muribaculaceae bacterium]|nr:hypothetical protein [Muribaculaceae bacterium]
MNPNAWLIRGKSLDRILQDYLERNGHIYDEHVAYLEALIADTSRGFDKTYMTEITEEFEQCKRQRAIEA